MVQVIDSKAVETPLLETLTDDFPPFCNRLISARPLYSSTALEPVEVPR